ncbi:MAG: hypothetical protein AB1Z67_10375 [Candidatus Limnocylindrales bacterium]
MASRLRITGVVLILLGIVALGASGYTYIRTQDSADSLQGFSEAQDVNLSYNADGQLIDRGSTEGADAILELLGETWRWPIVDAELDPNDPLVNTATEYMYQMATIAYHTLTGTQDVVLTEVAEWDGDGEEGISDDAVVYFGGAWDPSTSGVDEVFNPGVYEVPVDGRYWTQFNRLHPLDGPAREQTWSGTVHGLFAELGVGAVTASLAQVGVGIAAVVLLMGLGFLSTGILLIWTAMAKKEEEPPATA